MTLDEFVKKFAAEFEDTPAEIFNAGTKFKEIEEWGSLTALSIISLVDEYFDKKITGADLRSVGTIEELYNLIINR